MRRREVLAGLGAAAISFPVKAQQRVRRIGFLGAATKDGYAPLVQSLRGGLVALGWIEGKNLAIDYRWAEGNYSNLAPLARELLASKPDVIVTHGTPGVLAVQKETKSLPIVMVVSADAVASGLVESFARPGNNTTGQSFLAPEISAKRLELLKDAIPSLSRMATVFNVANPVAELDIRALGRTATARGVEFRSFGVRGKEDFGAVYSSIVDAGFEGVSLIHDAVLTANITPLAELALRHRLPSIGEGPYVKAGGLIGYGPDFSELWRSAATYVDKIFKGASPADLPVQLPTKFEFLLNVKTAQAIGVEIPAALLGRADQIIE